MMTRPASLTLVAKADVSIPTCLSLLQSKWSCPVLEPHEVLDHHPPLNLLLLLLSLIPPRISGTDSGKPELEMEET